MAVELFDNEFITALTADITPAQPTIPVAAAASTALQAAGGQFRVIVDAERMMVTAGANTNTWTVTRGIENTAPAAHTSGTEVAHVLTVGGFLNHHTIHEPGGADPFTLLDDTSFNTLAKDGLPTRPSLRTLGTGHQQAVAGDDARLSNSRSPTAHAASHRYNGSDPLYTLIPTNQAADYGAAVGDLVLMNGGHTITLPANPANNVQIGAIALNGQVTVARGGATDTINVGGVAGQVSFSIQTGTSVILYYFAGVWYALQSAASGGGGGGGISAKAYRNAAFTFTANTWQKIAVDTKVFDTGGNIDVANGRFIAPAAGYYHIDGEVRAVTPQGSQIYAALAVNGITSPLATIGSVNAANANQSFAANVNDVIQLNAGDYVELWAFASVADALAISAGQNYLSVTQVGQIGASQASAGQGIATAARVYRNAALTLVSGAWAVLPTDSVSYDPGNNSSASHDRYVCPSTGYYLVIGAVGTPGVTGQLLASGIFKNGVWQSQGDASVAGGANTEASTVVDVLSCQAGDYIQLAYFSSAATAVGTGAVSTYLDVVQIGGSNIVGSLSPTAQTSDYTGGAGQSVLMTGQHNYTLPNAPQNGTEEEVAALTGHVTVLRQGTDTITYGDSGLTRIMVPQGTTFRFRYLSGVWYVVDNPLGATDHLQNGIVNSGDLAVTAVSVTAATGAITFTIASGIAWVRTVNGVLLRVPLIGQTFTLVPAQLPAAGQQAVIGISLTQSGTVVLSNKGTDTATALNTPSLVASNSPAIAAGRMRIWDVVLINTAGSYTLGGTQLDRRPWARGALATCKGSASGTNYTVASASPTVVDAANLQVRLECTGAPVKIKYQATVWNNTVAGGIWMGVQVDAPSSGMLAQSRLTEPVANQLMAISGFCEYVPTAGSHLFTLYWYSNNTATMDNYNAGFPFMQIEEDLRANAQASGSQVGGVGNGIA